MHVRRIFYFEKFYVSYSSSDSTKEESMVSCRERITKSKHVLYWNILLQMFVLEGFVKGCSVGLTDYYNFL